MKTVEQTDYKRLTTVKPHQRLTQFPSQIKQKSSLIWLSLQHWKKFCASVGSFFQRGKVFRSNKPQFSTSQWGAFIQEPERTSKLYVGGPSQIQEKSQSTNCARIETTHQIHHLYKSLEFSKGIKTNSPFVHQIGLSCRSQRDVWSTLLENLMSFSVPFWIEPVPPMS